MSRRALAAALSAVAVAAPMLIGVSAAQATGDEITVHITPSPLHVGDMPVVSGVVTDSSGGSPIPVPGVSVTIQRSDQAGPYAPGMTVTQSDGSYSYTDTTPAVWKTLSYTVSLTSDSSQSGTGSTWVYRLPTTLKVSASRSIVDTGHPVLITAHLGTTATNRAVAIYAQPYQLDRRLVVQHDVDVNGNLTTSPTVNRRTRFIAQFAGDDKYAPASVYVVVLAHALVTEVLHGGYATVNGTRFYQASGVPVLSADLHPQLDAVCLWFKAQRWHNGAWRTVAAQCFRTDSTGSAVAKFTGSHELDVPYRLRARWCGGTAATADAAPWVRIEFR